MIAQGNLLVAPIRVVFEGSKQKEDLNLTNIGQDSAIYLVSFIHYQMQPDGSFKTIESADSFKMNADFVRIFPRKVTLPPGESQTIRLQSRTPSELSNGEYRSHLYFRAEKEVSALGMSTSNADSGKMSVSITPIFGISIPVIVRKGDLKFKTSITNPKLIVDNDSVAHVAFTINRTGERSSYGDLRVSFIPTTGKAFDVGAANGVGVYTDIASRQFNVPLRIQAGKPLKNGKLVVRYLLPREEGETELAKTELQIP